MLFHCKKKKVDKTKKPALPITQMRHFLIRIYSALPPPTFFVLSRQL